MSLGTSLIEGDFASFGENRVKVDVVCKKWDSRFLISCWQDTEFRLIVCRKNGQSYLVKLTIPKDQALEIISRLSLPCVQSPIFTSGKTYKRF